MSKPIKTWINVKRRLLTGQAWSWQYLEEAWKVTMNTSVAGWYCRVAFSRCFYNTIDVGKGDVILHPKTLGFISIKYMKQNKGWFWVLQDDCPVQGTGCPPKKHLEGICHFPVLETSLSHFHFPSVDCQSYASATSDSSKHIHIPRFV